MHNPVSVLENETHKLLWEFEIQRDNLISARLPYLIIIKKKKKKKQRTYRFGNLAVTSDHRVKLKESEMKDKDLYLARELKKNNKLWNMKVRVIPVVIGALGAVTKGLI